MSEDIICVRPETNELLIGSYKSCLFKLGICSFHDSDNGSFNIHTNSFLQPLDLGGREWPGVTTIVKEKHGMIG